MAEIILSTPEYLDVPFVSMEHATVQNIFQKITVRKHARIYCHARWSQPVASLPWLLEESKKVGVAFTLCLHCSDSLKNIQEVVTKDTPLEVSLQPGADLKCLRELDGFDKVIFFLPLAQPESHAKLLADALAIYPNPLKIQLAVGWKHRLSGPAPIAEEDHQRWADSLLSLIEGINLRSTKIEFACGLKLCLFNRMQLGALVTKSLTWPIATCPIPLYFSTEGTVEPCYRLRFPKKYNILEMENLAAMADEIARWTTPYSGLCYQSDTLDCRSLRAKSCCTGCLEHSLGEWSS